ncbi:ATP-binding protein [Geodermatophilus sp. YIM 151500]|uniref:ATP-binding protein n=1 Tax=Geodermatophilus sp. YIM 151500 TaxID=2984531 RepID=UPI0021E448D0|nr:ATP-binding protein [Geodermatophilus sp. YIM 151500]MCV2489238.1 ATP-binding protein [Geodermatophilus sp. YIM 151500]
MAVSGLKTRQPTGRVPWPCILLEGDEKAGKSWSLAQFSASDRIGALYWIDLNEGAGDEYGAIPGANYQIIEHDGSYAQVLAAVQMVKAEARRAADAGEPPVVLGIDTGSAIWDGLKDWASGRAAKSARNRELLKRDPNAEITISQNLWNDAGARWRKLQTELLTFPGIVVVTARGKEVTEVDANGRPIEGQKTWSVQTHREFPYAATVWMRLRRGRRPLIVGARSVHVGIKPNDDPAKEVTDPAATGRLLEWLVFDALKCDPGTAHVRDLVSFHGGGLLDHERTEEARTGRSDRRDEPDVADLVARIGDAGNDDELREVWAEANRGAVLQVEVPTPGGSYTVAELIAARHEEFVEASMAAHPAGRRRAPAAAQAPAAVGESDRPAVAAGPPATSGEAAPANPLLEASPTPDDPRERRLTAARRGVLASLQNLGVTGEEIGARFGRPVEHVATKRLTALVREVIATQRAGLAGQQEIVA